MQNDSGRLEERRRLYARRITSIAGIDTESRIGLEIRAAFEAIPREKFVGAPPWRIVSPEDQFQGVSDDPADIYQDVLVTLDAGKGLNNGQPSLHATCLKALAPQKGEHAVHVGAGSGYYTAILALLVGEAGRVDAYEIMPELARHAAASLAELRQVEIHSRSGAEAPLPDCDVLYVNAASAEPLGVWLDALRCGGRLLFPLEAGGEAGQMLLVSRLSEKDYAARFLTGVQFVACVGAQDPDAVRALEAAFRRGNWQGVRSLQRNDAPDESCWCAGQGWWLSTRSQFQSVVRVGC
jgi:protein-L-isoaspartate(D-aspartate) O-methyltransferase